MELIQKSIVDPKQILITYDFIDSMEKDHRLELEWEDIIFLMERICNDITDDCSLGHVFHKNGQAYFMEIYFDLDKDNSYIVDYYENISSDRYLDLMLENQIVQLSEERVREIL